MNFSTKTKVAAALGAGAVAVAGSGVAFAYWTASGAGDGTATAGDNSAGITVVQGSTISGMYPGEASDHALSGDFKNSNPNAAYVHTVTVSLASISNGTSTGHPNCGVGDFTLNANGSNAVKNGDSVTLTVNQEIAARAGYDETADAGSWSGVGIQMVETNADQDACKSATVNLSYVSN